MSRSRKSKFPLAELVKSLGADHVDGPVHAGGRRRLVRQLGLRRRRDAIRQSALKTVVDVASALAFIPLAYFLSGRALGRGKPVVVRRRLIVTYLLVGALPLLLMVALLALVLLAVLAQSSVNLVEGSSTVISNNPRPRPGRSAII